MQNKISKILEIRVTHVYKKYEELYDKIHFKADLARDSINNNEIRVYDSFQQNGRENCFTGRTDNFNGTPD